MWKIITVVRLSIRYNFHIEIESKVHIFFAVRERPSERSTLSKIWDWNYWDRFLSLTAAFSLQENGYRVKLFEKRNCPGRRMATARTAIYSIDHGTLYCTTGGNIFSNKEKKKKISNICEIKIL